MIFKCKCAITNGIPYPILMRSNTFKPRNGLLIMLVITSDLSWQRMYIKLWSALNIGCIFVSFIYHYFLSVPWSYLKVDFLPKAGYTITKKYNNCYPFDQNWYFQLVNVLQVHTWFCICFTDTSGLVECFVLVLMPPCDQEMNCKCKTKCNEGITLVLVTCVSVIIILKAI